jgi:hypothetical protein
MVAVGATAGTAVYFEVYSFDSSEWNTGTFVDYPVELSEELGIKELSAASISLAPTYLGSDDAERLAFVGVTIEGTNAGGASQADAEDDSGIYRLDDDSDEFIKEDQPIYSVAYDGTNLVAGHTTAPLSTAVMTRCRHPRPSRVLPQ